MYLITLYVCKIYFLYLQQAPPIGVQVFDQLLLDIPVREGSPVVLEELASNSFDQEHLQIKDIKI